MKRGIQAAAATICVALLWLGCTSTAHTSTSADQRNNSVTFNAPPGWQQKQIPGRSAKFQVAGMWLSHRPTLQTISYGYGPLPPGLGNQQTASNLGAQIQALLHGSGVPGKIIASRQRLLCNGKRAGWDFLARSTILNLDMTTETVYLTKGTTFASATYVRTQGAPQDTVAERALDSLCINE